MKRSIHLYFLLLAWGCVNPEPQAEIAALSGAEPVIPLVKWNIIDSIDVHGINHDLKPGLPTIDVGVYFPSNFDSAFDKVSLPLIVEGIKATKEIYASVGVQFNLLWVKTGTVDTRFFSIQANEVPPVPRTEYANLYQHILRHPFLLTRQATTAFQSIVEPDTDNPRTVYIIALQEVFLPYMDIYEGRNWMITSVRTGGLSFPPYSYVGTMPDKFRGVITITNLGRPDRLRRTIAHEIGHKVINVGHEYKEINPQNAVYAEGGLMVYGSGEEIPSGKDGRWHKERLLLSPFIYRLRDDGTKDWNPEYKEGGHYYDPIYGDKVVNFKGESGMPDQW